MRLTRIPRPPHPEAARPPCLSLCGPGQRREGCGLARGHGSLPAAAAAQEPRSGPARVFRVEAATRGGHLGDSDQGGRSGRRGAPGSAGGGEVVKIIKKMINATSGAFSPKNSKGSNLSGPQNPAERGAPGLPTTRPLGLETPSSPRAALPDARGRQGTPAGALRPAFPGTVGAPSPPGRSSPGTPPPRRGPTLTVGAVLQAAVDAAARVQLEVVLGGAVELAAPGRPAEVLVDAAAAARIAPQPRPGTRGGPAGLQQAEQQDPDQAHRGIAPAPRRRRLQANAAPMEGAAGPGRGARSRLPRQAVPTRAPR